MILKRALILGLASLAISCIELPEEIDGGGVGGSGPHIDGGTAGGGGEGWSCSELDWLACQTSSECVLLAQRLKMIEEDIPNSPPSGEECIEAAGLECALLDEASCEPRQDCIARRYDGGEFGDCQSAAEAACGRLDEPQCGARSDCNWDADHAGLCIETEVPCDAQPSSDACVASGCFWWADRCHEEQAPARCDQPDPAGCEAAGCEWGSEGCHIPMMKCEELPQHSCDARPDCDWDGRRCVEHQQEGCENLDEAACEATPGCRVEFSELNCGGCGCDPSDEPDCDCTCAVEFRCIPDSPQGCESLDPQHCMQDPSCRVEEAEICQGGERAGQTPEEDRAAEPVPEEVECWVDLICVSVEQPLCVGHQDPEVCEQDPSCDWVWEEAGLCNCEEFEEDCFCEAWGSCIPEDPQPRRCEEIDDVESCEAAPGCHVDQHCELCFDTPEPEGVDVDCFCNICVPDDPQPQRCEEIQDLERCEAAPGCHPEFDAFCGDCDDDGGINCFCEEQLRCLPDDPQPQACEEIREQVRCDEVPGCSWEAINCLCDDSDMECDCLEGGVCFSDAPPPVECEWLEEPEDCERQLGCEWFGVQDEECWCDDDGECGCNGGVGSGFCGPRRQLNDCEQIDDVARCFDQTGCDWIWLECPECPDGEACPQCDAVGSCTQAEQPVGECEEIQDPERCEGFRGCLWEDLVCACPPGEFCEDCAENDGVCLPVALPGDPCQRADNDPNLCEELDGCEWSWEECGEPDAMCEPRGLCRSPNGGDGEAPTP